MSRTLYLFHPILWDELTWSMVEIRYNRILIENNILSISVLNGDANQNWVTDDQDSIKRRSHL